jgi:DNA-directed RNA polymerase specialized sigma24 family protein
LRARLVQFFDWERCDAPEDLADEVMNRVARRIAEGEAVANVPAYLLGVARFIVREARSRQARETRVLAEYARHIGNADEPAALDDRVFECLDGCLAQLPPDRREHLLRYYTGEQSDRIAERERLASALGIGPVALRNRMLRMRQRLESCLQACLARQSGRDTSSRDGTVNRGPRQRPPREPHA